MNIFNYVGCHQNNSSSSHSLIYFPNAEVKDSRVKKQEFGWDFFTASSHKAKTDYLSYILYNKMYQLTKDNDIAISIVKQWLNSKFDNRGNIDHQSMYTIPSNWSGFGVDKQFWSEFSEYILQDGMIILGGNDNDENNHPLIGTLNSELRVIPIKELPSDYVARKDEKYNYWTMFNRNSGSKLRFSFDDKKSPTKSTAPELVDIKLTDYCPFACTYCYMGSTKEGKHGDTNSIISLSNALGKLKVFSVACFTGDTLVYTPNGAKEISTLNVGDFIYDSNGKISTVTNIKKSQRECIELTGNKGFKIKCTPEHPFIIDNKIIEAKDTLNKKLDQSNYVKENKIHTLDMSDMISVNKNGFTRGKIIGDKVKLSNANTYVDKNIDINNDTMFLYGISVAEGSTRGLSLHRKEINFAEKAVSVYKNITGYDSTIRNTGENALVVEFDKSLAYRKIFFDKMRIRHGARNKSINFLFELNNELVHSALYAMFLGDGCFRKKENNKYTDFLLSYKTSSKILANELVYILKIKFNVDSSLYHGVNSKRSIEGRELPQTDYYMIDIYGKSNINKIFPEIFENDDKYSKIGESIYSSNKNHNFIKIKEINKLDGLHEVYDITLDNDSNHEFNISHGVKVHNCGGGEPTMHPDFLKIITSFRYNGVVPNFTTKSFAWIKDEDQRKVILENCGSFAYSADSEIDITKLYTLLVKYDIDPKKFSIQFVMGAHNEYTFERVYRACEKYNFNLTLLGWKDDGRGKNYNKIDYTGWIDTVKKLIKEGLEVTLAIDTALAQQSLEALKKAEVPDWMYHVNEGAFSCYIDAVSHKISSSSYNRDEETFYDLTYMNKENTYGDKLSNEILEQYSKL